MVIDGEECERVRLLFAQGLPLTTSSSNKTNKILRIYVRIREFPRQEP